MRKTHHLIQTIRSYNPSLKKILIWNLLFCFGQGIFLLLFNLYLAKIVPELTIGSILGITYLTSALFSMLAGILADHIGTRKMLILGIAALFIGYSCSAMAEAPIVLYVTSMIVGIGQAFTIVIFVPLITEYSSRDEKKSVYNHAFASGQCMIFLGMMMSGLLVSQTVELFSLSQKESLRASILVGAIFIIVSVIPLLQVSNRNERSTQKENYLRDWRKYKGSFRYIGLYGLVKCIEGFGAGLVLPFINLFFYNRFHLEADTISLVLSIATLATVSLIMFNTFISQTFGEIRAIGIYLGLSIPSMLLLALTQSVWLAACGFLIFRALYFALSPIQSRMIMEHMHDQLKGITSSSGFMTSTIGMGLASPISMYLISIYGPDKGYTILFILAMLLIVIAYNLFIFMCIKSNISARQLHSEQA